MFPTGSTDYFVESPLFRNENLDRIRLIPDDYGIHAVYVEPSNDFLTPGRDICRGDYHSTFSVLMKFRLDSESYAVTFLNISGSDGPNFVITLDQCTSSLHVTFNRECPFSRQQLFFRPEYMRRNQWNRMSITVAEDYIAFYVNCRLADLVEFNTSQCRVQCNDETTVSILQPADMETCRGSTEPVSH